MPGKKSKAKRKVNSVISEMLDRQTCDVKRSVERPL